jgi:hypothetical protein
VPESRVEWELADLGFRWIGDFDASSSDRVVLLTRIYFSADNTCQAAVIHLRSQDDQTSMVEFSAELAPRGGICTNNNRQPGIFSYRPEKLVVRAPWKRTAQELFILHQALCGAAAQSGFSARPIHPSDLSLHVADDSRADYEGERARGCLYPISANTYQTTFVGALLYTPRIWFNLAHGHLFSWYHPSDQTLVARAQRRFARAADAAGLTR